MWINPARCLQSLESQARHAYSMRSCWEGPVKLRLEMFFQHFFVEDDEWMRWFNISDVQNAPLSGAWFLKSWSGNDCHSFSLMFYFALMNCLHGVHIPRLTGYQEMSILNASLPCEWHNGKWKCPSWHPTAMLNCHWNEQPPSISISLQSAIRVAPLIATSFPGYLRGGAHG